MTAKIYSDRNFYRSTESIFVHLIEVTGGVGLAPARKMKKGVDPEAFLAKCFGWWMALCHKVGVRSVEDLLWAKFPYCCPYCRLAPHDDDECKKQRAQPPAPNWDLLKSKRSQHSKPETLADWQIMFNKIYPRGGDASIEVSYVRLTEELGEVAEAIRALPVTKNAFLSEAADVFAWLMNIANVFDTKREMSVTRGSTLEANLWNEYPGYCRHCGYSICKCAPIVHLHRIASEVPDKAYEHLPGGNLFSLKEQVETFRLGDEEIRVAGETIRVNADVLSQLRQDSRKIMGALSRIETSTDNIQLDLVSVIVSLDRLSHTQIADSEMFEEIVAKIKKLDPERKKFVVDLLSGVASNALFAAIVKAVEVAPALVRHG